MFGVFLYNPKRHIDTLWGEISELEKGVLESKDKKLAYAMSLDGIEKRLSLISGIIECYFDLERDQEYIEKHLPQKHHLDLLKVLAKVRD